MDVSTIYPRCRSVILRPTGCSRLARVFAILLLCGTVPALGGTGTITPLGLLPDGSYPAVTALSGNGSTVVGSAISPSGGQTAFRWTAQHGFQLLQPLPGGSESRACSVSFDGQVIVGGATSAPPLQWQWNATRWASDGTVQVVSGHEQLPFSLATDISNLGTIAGFRFHSSQGGNDVYEGFYWQSEIGASALPMSGITQAGDEVRAISLDDSHVFGNPPWGSYEYGSTVVWTGFATPAPNVPGYISDAANNGIAVGQLKDSGGHWKPFLYSAGGTSSSLPILPSDASRSYLMTGIAADGSRLVGNSVNSYEEAWYVCESFGPDSSHFGIMPLMWASQSEVIHLAKYLSENGIEMSGWVLSTAVDISDDGLTILGEGYYHGVYQPFLVTIPEPTTTPVIVMGMILIRRRRQRRRRRRHY